MDIYNWKPGLIKGNQSIMDNQLWHGAVRAKSLMNQDRFGYGGSFRLQLRE